jgi:hypothetical protein
MPKTNTRTQEHIDAARRAIAAGDAALTTRSRHAIGGDAPTDTDGRMFVAERRARLIGQSLYALIHCEGDIEVDHETIKDFGTMAMELADELAAINAVTIAESYKQELAKADEPTAV